MQEVKLKTAQREVQGKAVKGLRQSGQVPGIVYGQGKDAMVVQADARSLEKAFQQAGTSKLITLEIEGVPPTNVLFHEVQHDPLSQRILHFDLYKVKMDEKIKTEVPIYLVGDAPAEHVHNAVILKTLESLEVEALPKDLPEHLEVDISNLKEIEQSILVKDVRTPEGVTILNEPEEMIVKAEAPQEAPEEEEELPPEGAEAELVEAEHGEAKEGEEAEGEEGKKSAKPEAAPSAEAGETQPDAELQEKAKKSK